MESKEKEETKTQNSTSQNSSQNIYLEEFMNLFEKMLNQIKYNLQSFNKKCDSMDRCFNNILLLKSNKPFDEEEIEEDEMQKQINELYSEYNPNNIYNSKKQNKRRSKETLRITTKELNNIEKMFEDMNENKKKNINKSSGNYNFLEKKKKTGRPTTKYMYEIDTFLKGGKIKDDANKNFNKKNKKIIGKNDKAISLEEEEDDDDQFIDHIILDKKIEKYTQFKEMLKKFEENKKDDGASDYENIDDDLDLDFDE